MKKAFCGLLVIALVAISCISSAEVAEESTDAIFQQALAADQAGDAQQRNRLLTDTLRIDPSHKLARWHSGQVLFNSKWKSVDAIERLVAHDPRWQKYRDRIESSVDTLVSHAGVARWCRSQHLELEEQWHWFNVLRHDPSHREALGSLGLRPFQGELLTAEQIAEYEAFEEQSKADFKRYAKLIKTSMREAERNDGPERAAALRKIAGITEPAAIQAVVEIVLADAKNEKRILSKLGTSNGEKLLRQMQLAAIAALSEMPEHTATLRLMEVALYASDAQIRTDAAQALKYRELTDFVPLLLAGLAEPIEYSVRVNMLSNGQVLLTEDYHTTGPLAESRELRSSTYASKIVRRNRNQNEIAFYRSIGQPVRPVFVYNNPAQDLVNASSKAQIASQQVIAENELREQRNQRINLVLSTVTGQELGDDPKAWWKTWMVFNELYTPEELPVYESTTVNDYSSVRMMSCFVAGTPVWTPSGKVAIETVKIGDFVLSQDPHTGELNYRPVIDTTIRPPSGTVRLGINKETLVTTRGHRFWIAGKGWEMAKFMKAGQPLVAVSGSIDLQSAEKGEEAVAYNLEVGQFHTYFVGENRLLVHDNTCPQPTTNTFPGVSPGADFAPQLAARN